MVRLHRGTDSKLHPYDKGVPRSKETAPPQDPTVGLCLGPHGSPRGGAVSYERGTPVART